MSRYEGEEPPRWISTGLTIDHKLAEFDCGKPELNTWLQNSALIAEQKWTSRTYVWVTEDDPTVRAYYSIAPTVLERDIDGLSRNMSAGLTRVPAFLLAKLALDRSLHGQSLGEQLLIDAITMILPAAHTTAGRLIVVDAIDDEAAAFYTRYGFDPVRNTRNRLVMKMSTAMQAYS